VNLLHRYRTSLSDALTSTARRDAVAWPDGALRRRIGSVPSGRRRPEHGHLSAIESATASVRDIRAF